MRISMLWLYDDLLDLYGDWGNLLVLSKRLEQMGIEASIDRASIHDTPDFSKYQLVYIGPGKARNLKRACEHLCTLRKQLVEAIASGVVFLVTGNARLMLGDHFTITRPNTEPEKVNGLCLFSYTGVDTGDVFISDVVSMPTHEENAEKTYGFVNRTSYIENNEGPYWFRILRGAGEAAHAGNPVVNDENAKNEGNLIGNLFSTWMLGPVLVKNPHLVREILSRLLPPEAIKPYDDSLAVKAWELTIADYPDAQ